MLVDGSMVGSFVRASGLKHSLLSPTDIHGRFCLVLFCLFHFCFLCHGWILPKVPVTRRSHQQCLPPSLLGYPTQLQTCGFGMILLTRRHGDADTLVADVGSPFRPFCNWLFGAILLVSCSHDTKGIDGHTKVSSNRVITCLFFIDLTNKYDPGAFAQISIMHHRSR